MFRKKKLYKIVYRLLETYTTIIEAKDEFQAINKFHKMTRYGIRPTILSFEEYKIHEVNDNDS